jgi:tRNA nucleotidyltransferase (CCA-adding enzyme)
MKYTINHENIQSKLKELLSSCPLVYVIAATIAHHKGTSYVVGGAVRDLLLGTYVKDIDIEVHGMSLDDLHKILSAYGTVNVVGKQYGVLRVSALDIDWSVPRTDASGRHPEVRIDPYMDIKQACARRDLTINALCIEILTGTLVDPFGGLTDLQQGVLRAPVPELFVEDPLRFFRVMQFIGRFQMHPDRILNDLCASMNIQDVAKERIEGELQKLLLKSERPSLGFAWLADINRLADVFPELAACQNVPQNPEWHPEGDVFEHTKQALDAAAALTYANQHEQLIIMYAALCHDLAKAVTTKIVDGVIRSSGHAQKGVPIAQKLLHRITDNKKMILAITTLVQYHMHPLELVQSDAKAAAYKWLAYALAPHVTMAMLAQLVTADKRGRNKDKAGPLTIDIPEVSLFREHAQQLGVLHDPEKPILTGHDLMPEIAPGASMGKLLQEAYALQIDNDIHDKATLKALVLKTHVK